MAARKSPGPSRRQAVVALGAGLIGGTIDLSGAQRATPAGKQATDSKTQRPAPPKPNPFAECAGKRTTEGYIDVQGKTQLYLASCCFYVNDVLHQGYAGSATETRAALKKFMDLLDAEKGLLDYAFIQFDVKRDKIEQVKNTVAGILKG